jgi:hypothetical protein
MRMAGSAALAIVFTALMAQRGISVGAQSFPAPVRFQEHVVAQEVAAGYQVIAVDLNRDQKLDLIGLGTAQKVDLKWYENPTWTPHLISSELLRMINAAAYDIDGDGIPELAVEHGFATAIKTSLGSVSLLTHGATPDAPWTRRDIDSLPTSHRIRWMNADGQKKVILVNAPLIGPSAETPDARASNQIVYYEAPDWTRQVIGEVEGLVHGILPTRQAPFATGKGDALLSAGFTGIVQHQWHHGAWVSQRLTAGSPADWPKSGSSDVVVGHHRRDPIFATLEPWHGNEVAVYRQVAGAWVRQLLDDQLTDAHALVMGDFDGSGMDAIVAGERQGQRSLYLYWPPAKLGDPWHKQVLDDSMNASACTVADLNGDKRPDIVCISGRAPSIKWYENLGK